MEDFHLLLKPTGAYISGTTSGVMSYSPPCSFLSPYISSYWGSERPTTKWSVQEFEPSLIVPDACVDIIFTIDHSNGIVEGGFCGISDHPGYAWSIKDRPNISRFAIQFYFWGVQYFMSDSIERSYNSYVDIEAYFPGWKSFFERLLLDKIDFHERVKLTDQFLKKKIQPNHYNQNAVNALSHILHAKGISSVKETCNYAVISQRQLERLFKGYFGMGIKKVSDLIRYQNLWHDIAFAKIGTIQDAVDKYYYVDQAHLLNNFRKYHTMTPREALKTAWRR
ncbi:helix-turn-helix domain-containing protein [Anaerocolumna sp. AGMB13025]|uniref:AraC family transcriptional regulator n=1 Tax=Anaerocolumna sp. AGMB13025 TaxID=3039116 RepID=UPI00241E9B7C|nr:helix-turn-helix domain-containing protein [Anaerocolumna sp. AGMB13025]WFR57323.1 helix-turn-helix domain-containing protein [Anaerocolumna sp. AGMB13025]